MARGNLNSVCYKTWYLRFFVLLHFYFIIYLLLFWFEIGTAVTIMITFLLVYRDLDFEKFRFYLELIHFKFDLQFDLKVFFASFKIIKI